MCKTYRVACNAEFYSQKARHSRYIYRQLVLVTKVAKMIWKNQNTISKMYHTWLDPDVEPLDQVQWDKIDRPSYCIVYYFNICTWCRSKITEGEINS